MGWIKDNILRGADKMEPQSLREQRTVTKDHDQEDSVKPLIYHSHLTPILPPHTSAPEPRHYLNLFWKEQQTAGAVGSLFSGSGLRPF